MNKDRILELAREAGLSNDFGNFGYPYLPELERFAALIVREVRGDVGPVAWRYKVIPPGWTYSEEKPNRDFFGDAWERIQAQPLYTHPTPAVVRQLFVSADRLRSRARYINNEQLIVGEEELMELKAALASARENGL